MLFAGSVVLLSGASLHRHSPSLSESTIQIQWEAEKPDVGIPLSNTSAQASASNRISRVVAELKDRDLLAEVSTECSLGTNWNTGSERATLALLEKRIRLEVFPEEHILNLSLSDLSPDSSALLANTLADHFFHRKMVELESVATEKLSRLQSELEVQRKGVETIQARLVEIGSSPSGSEIETEGGVSHSSAGGEASPRDGRSRGYSVAFSSPLPSGCGSRETRETVPAEDADLDSSRIGGWHSRGGDDRAGTDSARISFEDE